MYPRSSARESLRFWAPTGVLGTIATAAVVMLSSAALTAPSSAYPVDRAPADPTWGATSGAGGPDQVAPLCFIGRHSWAVDLVGPQPRCPR